MVERNDFREGFPSPDGVLQELGAPLPCVPWKISSRQVFSLSGVVGTEIHCQGLEEKVT